VYGFKMASGGIALLLAMAAYRKTGHLLDTGAPAESKGNGIFTKPAAYLLLRGY
jgi:hypothetical protein